jgi:hypothetical protein
VIPIQTRKTDCGVLNDNTSAFPSGVATGMRMAIKLGKPTSRLEKTEKIKLNGIPAGKVLKAENKLKRSINTVKASLIAVACSNSSGSALIGTTNSVVSVSMSIGIVRCGPNHKKTSNNKDGRINKGLAAIRSNPVAKARKTLIGRVVDSVPSLLTKPDSTIAASMGISGDTLPKGKKCLFIRRN